MELIRETCVFGGNKDVIAVVILRNCLDVALGDYLIPCCVASACEVRDQTDCSWIKLKGVRDD